MRRWMVLAGLLLLAGCSRWLGEAEAPPLPGERLSVLSLDRTLQADDSLADLQVILPPPEPMRDWPQAGGLADHAVHHVAIGAEVPRQAWRRNIGAGSSDNQELLLAQPVIAGGVVYSVDARATVTALRAEDGAQLWRRALRPKDEEGGVLGGGIAYDDGRLFVATGFAELIALDGQDGRVLWRTTLSGPMRTAPTVRRGRVFALTVDNQTHALSAVSGEVLWTHRGIAEGAAVLGAASPAVADGVVVTAYSSGDIFALRVENGREIWSDSLVSTRRTDAVAAISDIRGRPVIDRGVVIATANSGVTVAVDLRSGTRLWELEAGGIQSPWVAGDYVFLLTNTNDLMAVQRRSGRVRWVTPLPRYEDEEDRRGPLLWAGPVLVSDRLIVTGSHGEVLSVSPYNGAVTGREELPDGVGLSPSIAGDTLYFLTEDADLIAYR